MSYGQIYLQATLRIPLSPSLGINQRSIGSMQSPRSTQPNDRKLDRGLNEEGYLLKVQETS